MWLQFIRRFSSMTLICRWGAWTPWRTRSRSSWRARWWSTWSTTSWASLRTLTSSRDRRVPKLLAYSTLCVVTRQGLTLGYSDATLLLFLSLLMGIVCLDTSPGGRRRTRCWFWKWWSRLRLPGVPLLPSVCWHSADCPGGAGWRVARPSSRSLQPDIQLRGHSHCSAGGG